MLLLWWIATMDSQNKIANKTNHLVLIFLINMSRKTLLLRFYFNISILSNICNKKIIAVEVLCIIIGDNIC